MFILIGCGGSLGSNLKSEIIGRGLNLTCFGRSNLSDDDIYLDLTKQDEIEFKIEAIEVLGESDIAIINSGVIGEIGFASEIESGQFIDDITINSLSNVSLFKSLYKKGVRDFVIISSGAAKKKYSGWFTYCVSKSLQMEIWQSICHDHRNISVTFISPGVLDSKMHNFTKDLDESRYPDLKKFVDIKNKSQYSDIEGVAKTIVSKGEDIMKRVSRDGFEFIDLRTFSA